MIARCYHKRQFSKGRFLSKVLFTCTMIAVKKSRNRCWQEINRHPTDACLIFNDPPRQELLAKVLRTIVQSKQSITWRFFCCFLHDVINQAVDVVLEIVGLLCHCQREATYRQTFSPCIHWKRVFGIPHCITSLCEAQELRYERSTDSCYLLPLFVML